MVKDIIRYKPIKAGKSYLILVSGLFDWMDGEFRVNLQEEYEYHTTELFDVDLRRPFDRQRLYNYIEDISARVKLCGVYFSSDGLLGSNYYTWNRFKEDYPSFRMEWMKKVTLPEPFNK